MRVIDTIIFSLPVLSLLTLAGCSRADGKLSEPSPPTREGMASTRSARAPEQSAKVVVSFSLAQAYISLHEPVILNFTIENDTSGPVVVDLGANRKETFLFTIVKPDGSKAELPPKSPEGSALKGKISLRPGQTHSQSLLLNEWSEFEFLGQYQISVRLVEPHKRVVPLPKPDIYDIYDIPEFRTTLYIQPRDATRLNKICADLETRIINADGFSEASDAAQALSYIHDPVAIPYLEAALNSGHRVEGWAIAGFERIGGDEAIRALTAASKSKNKEAVFSAGRALERLRKKATTREE